MTERTGLFLGIYRSKFPLALQAPAAVQLVIVLPFHLWRVRKVKGIE